MSVYLTLSVVLKKPVRKWMEQIIHFPFLVMYFGSVIYVKGGLKLSIRKKTLKIFYSDFSLG